MRTKILLLALAFVFVVDTCADCYTLNVDNSVTKIECPEIVPELQFVIDKLKLQDDINTTITISK